MSLSPGYLSTLVRRRTGWTVVEWIAECRLVGVGLSVEEVGRGGGYNDPTYFA